MRSDNLKKHVKIHEKSVIDSQPLIIMGQKRQCSTDNLPTTDKGDFNIGKPENVKPKNPKIQALLDEIINDDPKRNVPPQVIHKGFSIVPPTKTSPSPKKVSTPPSTPPPSPKKMLLSPPKQQMLPLPKKMLLSPPK